MRIQFKGEVGQFIKATNEYEKIIAHAVTAAVKRAGKVAERAGRAAIAAGGFGPAWQRSFKSVMKPKTGDVLNPFAWIHSEINFSDVFEHGKVITPGKSGFLWLPLPNVPMWPGAKPPRQLSPKKYASIYGPLRTISRPGKAPMLGGVVRAGSSGKPTRKSFGGIRGTRGRLQIVPLFVGVRVSNIKKRFDVVSSVENVADNLPQYVAESLAQKRVI